MNGYQFSNPNASPVFLWLLVSVHGQWFPCCFYTTCTSVILSCDTDDIVHKFSLVGKLSLDKKWAVWCDLWNIITLNNIILGKKSRSICVSQYLLRHSERSVITIDIYQLSVINLLILLDTLKAYEHYGYYTKKWYVK